MMDGTLVRISTNIGNMDLQLLDQQTPLTVANFLNYVNSGRYNTTIFHRSIPGFVVQGGGYNTSNLALPIAKDPAVQNEPHGGNVRGSVALAKLPGDPNSGTSEFFVNLTDNTQNLDNQNGGFTVFGEVVGNTLPVADNIAALPTYNVQGSQFDQLPLTAFNPLNKIQTSNLVIINTASIVQATDIKLNPGKSVTFTDADGTTSTLTVTGGSATLHFTGTTISQSSNAKGFTVSGSAVSLDSFAFTTHTPKAVINVTAKGGNNAVRIGPVTTTGGGNLTINSTGAALAIDTIAITGSTATSSITVARANKAGVVEVDEITADHGLGVVSGPINLTIGLNASGTVKALNISTFNYAFVTAPSITAITANGIIGSSFATTNTIGAITAGAITGSTITTSKSIGTITANSITGTKVYSGADSLAAGTLPMAKTDFSFASSIRAINAKVFSNSVIVAANIGSANLGKVNLTNVTTNTGNTVHVPFGIGAKRIAALSFNSTKVTNVNSAAIAKAKKLSSKDFEVVVV